MFVYGFAMPATAVFSAAAAPVYAMATLDEHTFADDMITIKVEGCPPLCRRSERVGCGTSHPSNEGG